MAACHYDRVENDASKNEPTAKIIQIPLHESVESIYEEQLGNDCFDEAAHLAKAKHVISSQ